MATRFTPSRLWTLPLSLSLLVLVGAASLSPPLQSEEGQKAKDDLPRNVTPVAAGNTQGKLISMEEVQKHDNVENGLWVVIQGEVYE